MYNLPYAYAYALSDMRRITVVLMHILIQSPSSYKSSFSYKTSDNAETSEMLRLTIQVHMQHSDHKESSDGGCKKLMLFVGGFSFVLG
jgi:hypothetical protein